MPLKAVSTTISLVYFIILKGSTCEARKNVFLFYFEVCMLIWTNFETFAITYLIYAACFKNFICQWRLCLFANAKGSGTSFQVAVFVEFCDKTNFYHMVYTGQISLADCVYFSKYSVKRIPYFILRHLKTS